MTYSAWLHVIHSFNDLDSSKFACKKIWLLIGFLYYTVVYSVFSAADFSVDQYYKAEAKACASYKMYTGNQLGVYGSCGMGLGCCPRKCGVNTMIKTVQKTFGNSKVILYLFQIYASSKLKRILLNALKYRP